MNKLIFHTDNYIFYPATKKIVVNHHLDSFSEEYLLMITYLQFNFSHSSFSYKLYIDMKIFNKRLKTLGIRNEC